MAHTIILFHEMTVYVEKCGELNLKKKSFYFQGLNYVHNNNLLRAFFLSSAHLLAMSQASFSLFT